jgi:ribokinase
MTTGRVIVVGSLNIDLVSHSETLPAPGETVTGAAFSRHHGGKGGNQAVAAARLGAATTLIGAVGDDDFGADARVALEAEGIDLAGLAVVPEQTGVALILVDALGENLISVASGANAALSADHVRSSLDRLRPGPADVVLVGHEIPTPVARAALAAGRAAGATTILNPAPARGLDRSTFGLADVLTPNRGELATLVEVEARRVGRVASVAGRPETQARTLLDRSPEGDGVGRAVVVTLGAAGALVVRAGGGSLDVPARVVRAVDTVGAGDAFNGALAAGLAAGLDLNAAVARAIAAAAIATTRAGAREGMPSAAELEAALAGD